MGRDIRRVPVDFDWPTNKIWSGFEYPERLNGTPCVSCTGGYSPDAKRFQDLWYGLIPFSPADVGLPPVLPTTPEVDAFAVRNVRSSPSFYGNDAFAVHREASRLARLWNGMWMHHLSQPDVDALIEGGRLRDFTHTWDQENRWQPRIPAPVVTAADVNRWSLSGLGHDSINCSIVVKARCQREGVPYVCAACDGHGSTEVYPGQRAEADAWEPTPPPTGDGWQVWETTTEGSPISPVFADREGLIGWLMSPAFSMGVSRPMTRQQAEGFTADGWAPTMVVTGGQVIPGEQWIGDNR